MIDISSNIETIGVVVEVIKELFVNNVTDINETSSIVSDIVNNIGNSIGNKNINNTNKTITETRNELINEITLIKDVTQTSEVITKETGETILVDIVDNVFTTVNDLANNIQNNNNSNNTDNNENIFETEQIVVSTIDTIVNIDKTKNDKSETDNDLQEYTNNLFGRGASIALKGKEIGEQFNYKKIIELDDGTVYEVSISSTKIGRPNLGNPNTSAVNIEAPKCEINGANNTEYSLTFPNGFFDNNNDNSYDCTITQTNKNNYNDNNNNDDNNYGESNIVVANIFDNLNVIEYNTDLCNPYLIKIDMNATILNDNMDDMSQNNNNIFYPNCTFWNSSLNAFDNNNCYVYNYTNDTVICACNHLTTFNVKINDIIPQVNKLDEWHFRNLTFDNLTAHPTVTITILGFGLLSFILCLINPRSKNKNDIPSLAYDDIISKDFKNKTFKSEQYAYEIDLLNKYIPNQHKLGNGLLPLIKYNENDWDNMDDIDKSPKCNICYLQWKLFVLYLGNDHTILNEGNQVPTQLNKTDYIDELKKFRKKKQYTKIKYARKIIRKVIQSDNIKARYELVNEFRMIIFNQIYDFPHYCKYLGLIIVILWTTFAIILAIVYGLSFDILYPYRPEQFYPVTLQTPNKEPLISNEFRSLNCSSNNVAFNIETELSNTFADDIDASLKEYLLKFDNFGINITDSGTWLLSLLLSLILLS